MEPTPSPTLTPTSAPTPAARTLCGNNTWCYYVDLFPTKNLTTRSVSIFSETIGESSYHNVYLTSIGNDCLNPNIDVKFQEIDFSTSDTEYFDVFNANHNLISRCTGDQDSNCSAWKSCFSNEYLWISQINKNETYALTIEGSSALNALCTSYHSYSLNVELTITCEAG